jgi:hypothetical protein
MLFRPRAPEIYGPALVGGGEWIVGGKRHGARPARVGTSSARGGAGGMQRGGPRGAERRWQFVEFWVGIEQCRWDKHYMDERRAT